MQTATRGTLSLLAAFLAAVSVLTVAADGATLKHKKTGQIITGTLTQQKINQRRGFKLEDGNIRFIKLDEWKIIEADAPAPKPRPDTPKPDTRALPAPDTTKPAAADEKRVFIIPITGPIKQHCLPEAIDRALREAKARKATAVVFHIDTPGGYVYVAEKIIECVKNVDWATTISWVEGGDKQALSAGAYICMATHKILMAPGTTIGAATPYRLTWTGSAEVDEKFKSAFRAKFRSLAEQRGHSPVIADAMVDNSLSAVQVWLDDKQMIVTEDEARRLRGEHAKDKRFKRGKVIARKGKLLTLTSREALEFNVAGGIAATEDELLNQIGFRDAEVAKAVWLPAWVKQTTETRTKKLKKHETLFFHHFRQAAREDPHHQTCYVTESGNFVDGGQSWRERTDRSLAHLKRCAVALKELEKLLKDERYGAPISEESLNRMKMDMESTYRRLQRERNLTRPP